MDLQELYIVLISTLILACDNANAVDFQAEVDLEGDSKEIFQMIFKKLEMLGNRQQNASSNHSQSHTELASALLQVAPVVIIKGNITDSSRKYTISFTLQASQSRDLLDRISKEDDDDDDDGEDDGYDWRGSGGVFNPIVDAVEPYVLGFVELVFHGVISNVISNFLQSTTMMGDTRIV